MNKYNGKGPFFKTIYCANDISQIVQCFGAVFCDFDSGSKV